MSKFLTRLIDAPTVFMQHANKNDLAQNRFCLLDDYFKINDNGKPFSLHSSHTM